MKSAKEMMDDILSLKKENKKEIKIDINSKLEIVVENVLYSSGKKYISMELRNKETQEVYETTFNDYDNNIEIENSLIFLRKCVALSLH